MPSLQALAQRVKAVTSTARLTKTMKVVASVKLKVAQRNMDAGRPFAASMTGILDPVLGASEETPESVSLIATTSDKGLCGGINARIVKEAKNQIDGSGEAPTPQLLVLGGKGVAALQRTHSKHIRESIDEIYTVPPTFAMASFLTEQILASPADKYTILYNKFKSVIAQDVTQIDINGPEVLGGSGVLDEYEFEGDKEQVLADMYQFNMAATLYGALLENVTSEQASKMSAMENASNNATDMIQTLTLKYNRQRQAVITTELTEIVAGAESV
jgi:F-type H+-transporting ATPase subunit gamma